jgi:hypothetical protein
MNIKMKRCNKDLCSLAAGFHPRYSLPRYSLAYHTTLLHERSSHPLCQRGGRLHRVRCGVRHGGGCLLQLELVDLSKEISNPVILVYDLDLMLL